MLRLCLALVTGLVLSGCGDPAPRGGGDILAIGDSVLWWNGNSDRAIPDVVGKVLDREVVNRAVPGAQFDNDSSLASAAGFDIQRQYPGGRWNWIVMNGGANDVSSDCDCGACGPVVDALVSADGQSGSIPSFLAQLRQRSGAQILWMGYYAGSGKGSFEGCRDELVELDSRMNRFAAGRDWATFRDAEDVFDNTNPENFAFDNTHPSARGSAVIGTYLAKVIGPR